MRILISGGGTGGHFFPAMAALKSFQEKGFDVYYVGSRRGIEAEKVAAFTADFLLLELSGMLGHSALKKLQAGWQLVFAVKELLLLMRRMRPDAVVGFGGYSSAAAIIAGRLMGVPCFIHEQNAIAGLTNRLLDRVTTRSFSAYGNIGEHVGLPLRHSALVPAPADEREHLLILGGSQGSLFLNTFVGDHLGELTDLGMPVYHQTGSLMHEKHMQMLHERYGRQLPANYFPFAFSDDIHHIMAGSVAAISRSGAGAAFELMQLRVPSLFIPFPHAAHDHQYANAKYFEDRGCALVYRQEEFERGAMDKVRTFLSCVDQYHGNMQGLEIDTDASTLTERIIGAIRMG